MGHHFIPGDQWVASPLDMNVILVKKRLTSLHLFGESGFGKDKVKFCQKQDIALQIFGVRSSQGTEGNQDFLDFLLLFHSQFRQFVVQFDNGHWSMKKVDPVALWSWIMP